MRLYSNEKVISKITLHFFEAFIILKGNVSLMRKEIRRKRYRVLSKWHGENRRKKSLKQEREISTQEKRSMFVLLFCGIHSHKGIYTKTYFGKG